MGDILNFLINQNFDFWSRGVLILVTSGLLIWFLMLYKVKASLKVSTITSITLSIIIVVASYSFGFSCYKKYIEPKNSTTAILDLDEPFQMFIFDVLNIKYETEK